MGADTGFVYALDFGKIVSIGLQGNQVVPVVIQHQETNEVLMLGYLNEAALEATLRTKEVVLYSTSRRQLWHKGASSGDYLDVGSVWVNCEQNSLLIKATPRTGGVCHTTLPTGTHRPSCFYRQLTGWPPSLTNGESDPEG